MKKGNILLKYFLVVLCFPLTNVFGQSKATQSNVTASVRESSPIESFIRHVKETNRFVEVSNIWQADNNYDKTALLTCVDKVQPLTIDFGALNNLIQKNTTAINLVVPGINGGTYTIELAQYNVLNNGFEVHTMTAGVEEKFNYTPGKYYSGVVKGIPGSVAAFSFFNNEVYGVFSIPNVGNIVLVPNTMQQASSASNESYILYNEMDLKITNLAPKCATDQLNPDYLQNDLNKTTTTLNNNVYNSCKEVNVMELGDYDFYTKKGNSVAGVTNYLTALFNNEAVLYKNEGVLINLKYVQVNTTSDVYMTLANSSSDFLDAFGDDIKNTYSTAHGCHIAMLATTRYGSMGGVAWLRAMCATYNASSHYDATGISNLTGITVGATPTNFPTYSWNVEVMSHEMGHNVGSPHTHACVWNPPARNTAIDGCYTLEGSCAMPVPQYPAAKGTVMSYCHLVSGVGINFSNGFGPQPGDTIRNYLGKASTCGAQYTPSVALPIANRTIAANRECTDLTSGLTYYWYDANTADQNDDTLVLIINKGSNNIGNLNTAGFAVTANTTVPYGTGTGAPLTFPAGTSASILAQSYGMHRYWSITPSSNPATAVEVYFPFLQTDTVDVHGSLSAGTPAPLSGYLMYKANAPVNPNPELSFPGAAASDFQIYTYAATSSTTNWTYSAVGLTKFARMKMTNLSGGGSGFYSYCVPHPAPTPGTMPPAPCPGAVVTYSVVPDPTATSYTWTISGAGWSGTSTTDAITLTAGTGPATITVRGVDSCGSGLGTVFNVTPAPLPTVTISATSQTCVGTPTLSLSAAGTASPTSYTWTVLPAGGWSGSSSTSTITVNAGTGTGTIIANATNVCGTGPNDTFYAVMNATAPLGPTTITPPALICPSSTGTFTTPALAGATSYAWTVSGTGWSGSSSTTTISASIGTGIGTFMVHGINACGVGPDYTRNFSTSTGPGASTSIIAPATPCSGTTITLSTPAVPTASSYTWVVSGPGWSGGTGTGSSINLTVGVGTATVTVNPVNACGAGGSYTAYVTPTPAPTSTFALSTHLTTVNSDVYAYYTGTAAAGSVFTWNFPGGVGAPGVGAVPQTVHWTTPGQYLVFLNVSNGAGCSSATADTVHVMPGTGIPNAGVDKIDAGIVPNPNNGAFDILFTNAVTEQVSVKMFDVQGRVVYSNSFANAADKKIAVKTNNLAPGTYTITISIADNSVSKKITIVR